MGFPTRITRATLGPELLNRHRVVDPRKEIGADVFNLAWWTLGAAGLMLPMARFVCTQSGTAIPVVASHAEAFRPNSGGSGPTMGRSGAGVYSFDWAAQYPDETGTNRPVVFEGGIAVPLVAAFRHGQVEMDAVDPTLGTIRFWSDGGATPADCAKFMVFLW